MSPRTSTSGLGMAIYLVLSGCSGVAGGEPGRQPKAAAVSAASVPTRDEPPSAAPNDENETAEDPRFAEAIRLHLSGVGGNDKDAERALELLAKLAPRRTNDSRFLVYFGSAKILAAKRVWAPWEKGRTAKAGLELVDRAVKLAPDDSEVRFLRAMSTYPLPGFFGRSEEAATDFAWLSGRIESALARDELTPSMAACTLVHHGRCQRERGDLESARRAWNRAIKIAPRSAFAEEARTELGIASVHAK